MSKIWIISFFTLIILLSFGCQMRYGFRDKVKISNHVQIKIAKNETVFDKVNHDRFLAFEGSEFAPVDMFNHKTKQVNSIPQNHENKKIGKKEITFTKRNQKYKADSVNLSSKSNPIFFWLGLISVVFFFSILIALGAPAGAIIIGLLFLLIIYLLVNKRKKQSTGKQDKNDFKQPENNENDLNKNEKLHRLNNILHILLLISLFSILLGLIPGLSGLIALGILLSIPILIVSILALKLKPKGSEKRLLQISFVSAISLVLLILSYVFFALIYALLNS